MLTQMEDQLHRKIVTAQDRAMSKVPRPFGCDTQPRINVSSFVLLTAVAFMPGQDSDDELEATLPDS
jgi:hypothetical protein